MKRAVIVGTLAVLLVGSAKSQEVGQVSPDFTYRALDGSQISLSDHSGKVVFLFLFGNMCPPCLAVGNRTEQEVNAVFGSNPSFQAIGLDLWNSTSTTASVNAFKARTGITYPLGLQAGGMASLYVTTYDRILIVGPDGLLRFKGSSVVSHELNEAKDLVAALLAQVATNSEELPDATFSLEQNYPNPFQGSTDITFQVGQAGAARLVIHDLLGREVTILAQGFQAVGRHSFSWKAPSGTPPGMYFYTLETAGQRQTRSLMVMR